MNNQQRARNWRLVRAFRSGKYRQTKYSLFRLGDKGERCFCAEGVACHLSKLFKWVKNPGLSVAPHEVNKYYGWRPESCPDLLKWNDGLELSFSEIADRLEAWLLEQDQEAA